MYPGGYTAEVTSLSSKATEKDVYDFFSHCGALEHVEIMSFVQRNPKFESTANVMSFAYQEGARMAHWVDKMTNLSFVRGKKYNSGSSLPLQIWRIGLCWTAGYVKFTDAYALEIAILLSVHTSQCISSPGEAIIVYEEVVKTMVAKGYILGQDALIKAKALDESYQVSATAATKVYELSNRIGLTERIHASREVVQSLDKNLYVSDITKSAATATGTAVVVAATVTGKAAYAAGSAVVNSSYFAKGALWVSDMLTRAGKAAADLGSHDSK